MNKGIRKTHTEKTSIVVEHNNATRNLNFFSTKGGKHYFSWLDDDHFTKTNKTNDGEDEPFGFHQPSA